MNALLLARSFVEAEATGALMLWLWLGATILVIVLLQLLFSAKAQQQREARREFRELATVNGLTGRECRLLWRIACKQVPQELLFAFVRPSLLEAAPSRGSPETLQAIRRKLFGD